MKKYIFTLLLIACIHFSGCESVAFYAIDEKPKIKIDANLLGLWQIDNSDYYLIQSFDDVYKQLHENDKKDSTYILEEKSKDYIYYITEIGDQKMEIPILVAFISKTNRGMFANVAPIRHRTVYFFVNISVDKVYKTGSLTPTYDTTLNSLTSSAQVKDHIEKDADKILRFDSKIGCVKISSQHSSVKLAKSLACKLWKKKFDVHMEREWK